MINLEIAYSVSSVNIIPFFINLSLKNIYLWLQLILIQGVLLIIAKVRLRKAF